MDFFGAQAAARRRTAILLAWFAAGWLATIALVHLLVGLVLATGLAGFPGELAFGPESLAAAVALVSLVVAAGSAWHGLRIARGGGHAVARLVGGEPVDRGSADPALRRLVNVTEEMAIAAGLPAPALYLLPDEEGINAFAAGLAPDRAVVAVTRGALDALDRDELQGVVAHELSHVLNGDARLNLRLVALVGGLTVLALVGRSLVSGAPRRGPRRAGRGRSLVPVLGACLWVAGSIGALFGRVIRAAVSRQRELLADAAAVQLTRNPVGLAGALSKIAARGSALRSARTPELSHLLFASGLRSRWLATHPPVEERLRRLGAHPEAPAGDAPSRRRAGSPGARPSAAGAAPGGPWGASGLAPFDVARAAELHGGLPAAALAAARSPEAAPALVAALLVDGDPAARERQLAAIRSEPRAGEVPALASLLAGASREARFALLEVALPALDGLSREAADALLAGLRALAGEDGRTSVFEWALLRVVERRVAPGAAGRGARPPAARSVGEVAVEALELLSALAWLGSRDAGDAGAAVLAGAAALGERGWRPLPRDRVRAARLDAALRRLDGASPPLKARLVEACAACVLADGRVAAAEAEVLRAVAASLGVPMPPLAGAAEARAAG